MVFAIVRVVSLDSSVNGGQVSTTWLIFWGAIEGAVGMCFFLASIRLSLRKTDPCTKSPFQTAIIVGCLPSFAVFIRGRVEASRVQYGTYTANASSIGNKLPSHLSHSRKKSYVRSESVLLEDLEPNGETEDSGSHKSLVDGTIVITHGWSQKWHKGGSEDKEQEREQRLGFRDNM